MRRFLVRGFYNEYYLVDLDEYSKNGWCGCKDFEFRCQPDLERGEHNVAKLRCKHIEIAVAFYHLYETKKRQATKAAQAMLGQAIRSASNLLEAEEGLPSKESSMLGMPPDRAFPAQHALPRCPPHSRQSRENAQ